MGKKRRASPRNEATNTTPAATSATLSDAAVPSPAATSVVLRLRGPPCPNSPSRVPTSTPAAVKHTHARSAARTAPAALLDFVPLCSSIISLITWSLPADRRTPLRPCLPLRRRTLPERARFSIGSGSRSESCAPRLVLFYRALSGLSAWSAWKTAPEWSRSKRSAPVFPSSWRVTCRRRGSYRRHCRARLGSFPFTMEHRSHCAPRVSGHWGRSAAGSFGWLFGSGIRRDLKLTAVVARCHAAQALE